MSELLNHKTIDTVYVGIYDSTMVVKGKTEQIIIIQNHKSNETNKIDWVGSLWIPVTIILISGAIAYFFGWRKMNASVQSLKSSTKKSDEEVEKLQAETEKLKSSYQPVIINTLTKIQEKVFDKKIEALNQTVLYRNKFRDFTRQYDEEGNLLKYRDKDFHKHIFKVNVDLCTGEFRQLKEKHAYLFSDIVFNEMNVLGRMLYKIEEDFQLYREAYSDGLELSKNILDRIPQILEEIDSCIVLIRKDCHLDSNFINDFIEINSNIK